jgi:acid phosphatase family membrane protein YuiD
LGRPGRPAGRAAFKEVATAPFWIALICGFVVQGYKGFTSYFETGRWNLRRFVETGGMPSSHSASVAALSTAVGLQEGFGSALFGVTLYFSLIVMYDAAGLRRAAGRQAAVLNRLIERHFKHPQDDTQRLMELLGHTPFEVLVGGLLGVLTALLWNRIHPL